MCDRKKKESFEAAADVAFVDKNHICKIWGFHGSEDSSCLLCCDTV